MTLNFYAAGTAEPLRRDPTRSFLDEIDRCTLRTVVALGLKRRRLRPLPSELDQELLRALGVKPRRRSPKTCTRGADPCGRSTGPVSC